MIYIAIFVNEINDNIIKCKVGSFSPIELDNGQVIYAIDKDLHLFTEFINYTKETLDIELGKFQDDDGEEVAHVIPSRLIPEIYSYLVKGVELSFDMVKYSLKSQGIHPKPSLPQMITHRRAMVCMVDTTDDVDYCVVEMGIDFSNAFIGRKAYSAEEIATELALSKWTEGGDPDPVEFEDTASLILATTGAKNVSIPRTGAFHDLSTAFTMFAWWNSKTAWNTGTKYMYEITSMFYTYKGTYLSSRIFDATGNTTSNSTASFTDDSWHLLGYTYDGAGGWASIVDGSIVANTNTRVLVSGNTADLQLGERSGFGVSDWLVDELHIVNRVITAEELTTIYNSGTADYDVSALLGTDLKHRYRMENSTTNYFDDIGGIHGVFNNSPESTTEVPV